MNDKKIRETRVDADRAYRVVWRPPPGSDLERRGVDASGRFVWFAVGRRRGVEEWFRFLGFEDDLGVAAPFVIHDALAPNKGQHYHYDAPFPERGAEYYDVLLLRALPATMRTQAAYQRARAEKEAEIERARPPQVDYEEVRARIWAEASGEPAEGAAQRQPPNAQSAQQAQREQTAQSEPRQASGPRQAQQASAERARKSAERAAPSEGRPHTHNPYAHQVLPPNVAPATAESGGRIVIPPPRADDEDDPADDDTHLKRFTAFLAQRRAETDAAADTARAARGAQRSQPRQPADTDDEDAQDEIMDEDPRDQIADDDEEDNAVAHALFAQGVGADIVAINPPPPFQSGGATYAPDPAALKGDHLKGLILDEAAPHVSHLARLGFVKETRQLHRRMLRQIAAMNGNLAKLPLATAIIAQLTDEARDRQWQPQTLLKYLASCQGALSHLPLYSNSRESILLGRDPEWQQAMRAARKYAREAVAREPRPLTTEGLEIAFGNAETQELQAFIALTWVTCARPGCTRQLKYEDIALSPPNPDGSTNVAVTFRRGKGVIFRGPYTVHSVLWPSAAAALRHTMAQARLPTAFLWAQEKHYHDIQQQLLRTLRSADPALEQKSMRRGSLQHLAALGFDARTLMHFSGHTQERTLQRYLSWGAKSGELRNRTLQAAPHLMPTARANHNA